VREATSLSTRSVALRLPSATSGAQALLPLTDTLFDEIAKAEALTKVKANVKIFFISEPIPK
jgi:hypothetical protein